MHGDLISGALVCASGRRMTVGAAGSGIQLLRRSGDPCPAAAFQRGAHCGTGDERSVEVSAARAVQPRRQG